MRERNGQLFFAPTDLSRFLVCRRLTSLSRSVALGELSRPPEYEDPRLEALIEAGKKHEGEILERYRGEGCSVEAIGDSAGFSDRRDQTLDAMRRGVAVIHQGYLVQGRWSGYPDFLVRTPQPSALGDWSYEVVDAKLATVPKADAVLQIAVYSRLLEKAQGAGPVQMHLELGRGQGRESFRVTDFAAFERALAREFEEHCANPPGTYPEPVEFCAQCDWDAVCRGRRRTDDHLSLVANSTRHQRRRLETRGITTLTALAGVGLPLDPPLARVAPAVLERIQRQAQVQLTGYERNRPIYELALPPEDGRGLLKLPAPSDGDLFFDIESSRPGADEALEYLFGFVDRDGRYEDRWAFSRDGERRVFEEFMDLVAARRKRFPDLHIYHYGGYETGALKRLMSRYATREDAMDGLLRRQVFVDLLQVVRQGVVASVESYSIKEMEPFYGFAREQELLEASRARARMDALLDSGNTAASTLSQDRELIRRYNREDCVSTLKLHGWLEERRQELTDRIGPRERPVVEITPEDEEAQTEAAKRVSELVARLASGPEEEAGARRLLGHLLDYYRREDKATWWEYFRVKDLDAQELVEDPAPLGGLEFDQDLGPEKRSVLHRYRFPPQEHRIKLGKKVEDFDTGKSAGEVFEITPGAVTLKRSRTALRQPHPRALVPDEHVRPVPKPGSVFHLGERVADHGFADDSPHRAALDLLRRIPPRAGAPGEPLVHPGEDVVAAARRLALDLDRGVLAVQGPPGSGKTYVGARIVTVLLAAGRRVGVTAQSHRVITNLLDGVCAAATEEGLDFRGVQGVRETGCDDPRIEVVTGPSRLTAEAAASSGVRLVGGTAWVWSREDMRDSVDVLVVDEAGQFALADALASAPAAKSLVLLGDPAQLDQVTQGVHPDGSAASALGHLLGERKTMPADQGLFLEATWRMHPDICRFTSEQFYEGRLQARPGLERQAIRGGPLPGAGLRFAPVSHEGNQTESPEEAERVEELVDGLLGGASWTDDRGVSRPVTPDDILVVVPYNDHLALLDRRLGDRVRGVGTVDKFQGQEAPVVFFSMATSTPEAAPRGMDFLYSAHRLNVATSRARGLAVVVASPKLFFPECKTPDQMRLANAFCRFRELAEEIR
jgi:uncharacterized protein